MKYGYARVSTPKQSMLRQIGRLKKAGAEIIIEEVASSAKDRKRLEQLLYDMEKGDVLIIDRISRMSRSIQDAVKKFQLLQGKGVDLICLDGGKVDTTSAQGKLFWHTMVLFAEFERDMASARSEEGLRARKDAGVKLGRSEINPKEKNEIIRLHLKGYSPKRIAEITHLSRPTIYKYIKIYEDKQKKGTSNEKK